METHQTIHELAAEETRLLAVVERAHGLIEAKEAELDYAGVYDSYRAVHVAYARLITNPIDGLEALKRALFLQWIAQIEPSCFTGVREIETGVEQYVIQATSRRLADHLADTELIVMLNWYASLTDWYFAQFPLMPQREGCTHDESTQQLAAVFTEQSLTNRGQMGRYWQSVIMSRLRRESTA